MVYLHASADIVLYVIKIVFLQNKNEIFFGFAYIFTISAIL